ncbi:hypothetical protein ACLB1O_07525 [Escherichia coli]
MQCTYLTARGTSTYNTCTLKVVSWG